MPEGSSINSANQQPIRSPNTNLFSEEASGRIVLIAWNQHFRKLKGSTKPPSRADILRVHSFLNREGYRFATGVWIEAQSSKVLQRNRAESRFLERLRKLTAAVVDLIGNAPEEYILTLTEYQTFFDDVPLDLKTRN
jgi:hypothetical protein